MNRIGIIAEGTTDQAVLINLLRAFGVDSSQIIRIRPAADESDRHHPSGTRSFGGWPYVQQDCADGARIAQFFSVAGNDLLVIHLDTAEADQYGVERPEKKNHPEYCRQLRERVTGQIRSWLENGAEVPEHQIAYAVAIEEIEAWMLCLFGYSNTHGSANPKEKLKSAASKKNLKFREDFAGYHELSRGFRKKKDLDAVRNQNPSLDAFAAELERLILPGAQTEE
jgi:hypothetical protein